MHDVDFVKKPVAYKQYTVCNYTQCSIYTYHYYHYVANHWHNNLNIELKSTKRYNEY